MTPAEARRIFVLERKRFARTYPSVATATFEIIDRDGDSDRDYAQELDLRVSLLRRALALPKRNVVALIRHELGHCATPGGSEQDADDAAEHATGVKIRYDTRDVQTIGPGKYPRPLYLRR